MKPRIIIAGGSGFIGRALLPALSAAGYEPVVLTTGDGVDVIGKGGDREDRGGEGDGGFKSLSRVTWDGVQTGAWAGALEGAAAIINLAGASMDCRYTPANQSRLTDSRLLPIRALAAACRECATPPRVWIQAGSAGIYGDAGDVWCSEASPQGDGFPAELARRVEAEFFGAELPGIRRVLFRFGFVFGRHGGALPEYVRLVRRGFGSAAGSGRQWVSWLHEEDLRRVILRTLRDNTMQGLYNACAPEPVTNAVLMRTLRATLGWPALPGVPAGVVKFVAWIMDREPSLALEGRRVRPAALLRAGCAFAFPHLAPALRDLLAAEAAPLPPQPAIP